MGLPCEYLSQLIKTQWLLISFSIFKVLNKSNEIMHFHNITTLTSFWTLVELVHKSEWVLNNIQDGQQGACETQQITKAVEPKVYQVTSQIHHLERRVKQVIHY